LIDINQVHPEVGLSLWRGSQVVRGSVFNRIPLGWSARPVKGGAERRGYRPFTEGSLFTVERSPSPDALAVGGGTPSGERPCPASAALHILTLSNVPNSDRTTLQCTLQPPELPY